MAVFTVSLPIFAFLLVLAGVAWLLVTWFLYDFRDKRFYREERDVHAFHCNRCSILYEARGSEETAPCPRCGTRNPRLRF